MKIKQLFTAIFLSVCVLMSGTVMANSGPGEEVPKEVRAKQIEHRLLEIKQLAKQESLTSTEKKDLRKEVKNLRKEAQSRGIYLSIGAIVIIILLLILILK